MLKRPFLIYLIRHPSLQVDKKSIRIQYAAGLFVLCLGIVLALPVVPGPGILLVLMGLLMFRPPGCNSITRWLDQKHSFKKFRYWLEQRLHIHLVTEVELPQATHSW